MTNNVHLDIQQLTKKFDEKLVLKDITVTIPAGQFVAIVGKSGCGKSTLLRILAGLDQHTSGQLTQNSASANSANVRVMFQEDRLLPWLSILENVGVGTSLQNGWKERAKQALQLVGLEDRADEWPHVLSGGQKQRIALARALSSQPELLLLDEPLGALDALTRLEMQRLIEQLWQKNQHTTILVTHDVSEAVALADRILLIEDGHIALDLAVDLPRPRSKTTSEFNAIEELLLHRLLHHQGNERLVATPILKEAFA